jgi:ribosomal protein S12 methylthiotransferase accessory factor YcaO
LAFLKALVEYTERLAFIRGAKKGIHECQTKSSDGFAAYPILNNNKIVSISKARTNAFSEALERYVWAMWWDNCTGSNITTLESLNSCDKINIRLYHSCFKILPIENIKIVLPFHDVNSFVVVIFIAKLKNGGFVTGGAAGKTSEFNKTIFRALSELFRHLLASKKILTEHIKPVTFYENRLAVYATGQENTEVEKRLLSKKTSIPQSTHGPSDYIQKSPSSMGEHSGMVSDHESF